MPTRAMLTYLRELYAYRPLLASLVARDLRLRYKRSVLGVVWAFTEPLAMMALLTVVFSYLLRLSVPNYPLLVLSGVLAWGFFSSGVTHALPAVSGNANLVKKIYFPRAVLPLATVVGRFVHFLLSLLLLAPFLLYFDVPLGAGLLLVPLVALVQLCLVAGLALLLTPLGTLYDDVGFLTGFAFTALFYVSPVFYPVESVPAAYRSLFMLNPMATIITAYRSLLFGTAPPTPLELGVTVGVSLACLILGVAVFRRLEWGFAEVL